jgi:hypothetical protein
MVYFRMFFDSSEEYTMPFSFLYFLQWKIKRIKIFK